MNSFSKKLISFLIVLIFFVQFNLLFAQLNTLGKEFYFGFIENYGTSFLPVTGSVIVTAKEKTTGYIEFNNQKTFFTLEAGQQFVKDYDENRDFILHRSSGVVEKKSIYVNSTGLVAVHAFNKRQASADGSVILPLTALGKEYYITAHYDEFEPGLDVSPSNRNFESTLLIVAVEDGTDVEINPTTRVDLNGNPVPAVAPIRITMDAGETFQLKAITGDLTGTRVRVLNSATGDCKNLAVFGGNKMTSAGENCATTGDHLFQQSYPVTSWGKSFIHIPLADRSSGEIIKVVAAHDNTQVRINGQLRGTINQGKFLTFEFGRNDIVAIETSKPSSVSMIGKSTNCNDPNDTYSRYGDPSLVTLSPVNQMMKDMVFSSVKINWVRFHLVNILVKKGTANQTVLNGLPVGNQFKPVPTNPAFEYARIAVNEGANRLQNPEGFIAYAYGSGAVESYAYPVGATLEAIQFETETTYKFEVEGDKVACLGEEGIWEIFPDFSGFKEYTWSFGDESPVKDGKKVAHTFQKPGKYEVSVIASTGEGRCDSEETFRFEVEVQEVSGTLEGPESVCPLIDEFVYTFVSPLPVGRLKWEVIGGTVLEEKDSQVKVKWGVAGQPAKVKAMPFTEAGCPGNAVEVSVLITETLEPTLPKGSSGICGPNLPQLYEVPFPSSERTYSWTIVGGTLNSGQNTSKVEILWDFSAPIRSVFYEENSKINGACAGVSDVLVVKIFPELKLETTIVTDPLCPEQANGRVQLLPSGGSGSYTYSWSHDANLKTGLATGLAEGSYTVIVKDASGCAEISRTFELKDPEPIRLEGGVAAVDNSCFGGTDGVFRMKMLGGTPPFSAVGFATTWDGTFLEVQGVGPGNYQLTVQDSKGCTLPVEATLEGPEEIKVEVDILKPGCAGSLDGALSLQISGGVPPYQVVWDNGKTGPTIDELPPGEFAYTITDAKGCVLVGLARVNQAQPQLRMPTGFDPREEVFQPVSNCSVSYELMIWDRWGDLIFVGSEGWDGKVKGQNAPISTYSYQIRYTYLLESVETTSEKSGIFTLIR
jgi:PKD repeat protein